MPATKRGNLFNCCARRQRVLQPEPPESTAAPLSSYWLLSIVNERVALVCSTILVSTFAERFQQRFLATLRERDGSKNDSTYYRPRSLTITRIILGRDSTPTFCRTTACKTASLAERIVEDRLICCIDVATLNSPGAMQHSRYGTARRQLHHAGFAYGTASRCHSRLKKFVRCCAHDEFLGRGVYRG